MMTPINAIRVIHFMLRSVLLMFRNSSWMSEEGERVASELEMPGEILSGFNSCMGLLRYSLYWSTLPGEDTKFFNAPFTVIFIHNGQRCLSQGSSWFVFGQVSSPDRSAVASSAKCLSSTPTGGWPTARPFSTPRTFHSAIRFESSCPPFPC